MQAPEEILRRLDAEHRRLVRIHIVHVPDVSCKARKPRGLRLPHIPRPAAPHGGKRFSVDGVEFLAQRMAELMRGEFTRRAKAGQSVV